MNEPSGDQIVVKVWPLLHITLTLPATAVVFSTKSFGASPSANRKTGTSLKLIESPYPNQLTGAHEGFHYGQNVNSAHQVLVVKAGENMTEEFKPVQNSNEVVIESRRFSNSITADKLEDFGLNAQQAKAWLKGRSDGLEIAGTITDSDSTAVEVTTDKDGKKHGTAVSKESYFDGLVEFNPSTGMVTGASPEARLTHTATVFMSFDHETVSGSVNGYGIPPSDSRSTLRIQSN